MATIRHYSIFAHLRSEASNHLIHLRKGKLARQGRGLAFWFMPENASIIELPMDDRQTSIFIKGRSKDFQDVAIQGAVIWQITDVDKLASRIDFTIDLNTGLHNAEPMSRIEARLHALVQQCAQDYFAKAAVRDLLDAGADPIRERMDEALKAAPSLAEVGIAVVEVSVGNVLPSSELERALQTPTFEALQQKADQATFERRALAVEKERAIAENELANKTELARRENELIDQEAENVRRRAASDAEANRIKAEAAADAVRIRAEADASGDRIRAEADAERIERVEGASVQAERERMAIYRDLPREALIGLAAREFAQNLTHIDQLNITPDLLAMLTRELKGLTPPPAPPEPPAFAPLDR